MQFIFDSGKQSTLAGFGQMFENFLQTATISNFTGKGQSPATVKQGHFHEA